MASSPSLPMPRIWQGHHVRRSERDWEEKWSWDCSRDAERGSLVGEELRLVYCVGTTCRGGFLCVCVWAVLTASHEIKTADICLDCLLSENGVKQEITVKLKELQMWKLVEKMKKKKIYSCLASYVLRWNYSKSAVFFHGKKQRFINRSSTLLNCCMCWIWLSLAERKKKKTTSSKCSKEGSGRKKVLLAHFHSFHFKIRVPLPYDTYLYINRYINLVFLLVKPTAWEHWLNRK